MFSILAFPIRVLAVPRKRIIPLSRPSPRSMAEVLAAALPGFVVVVVTVACGHGDLLSRMSVFQGAQQIQGVTEFLNAIKGYLLSIVLAGFTVAAIGAGAAKFVGHSRANDLLFNIGVGIAIFAAIPTIAG